MADVILRQDHLCSLKGRPIYFPHTTTLKFQKIISTFPHEWPRNYLWKWCSSLAFKPGLAIIKWIFCLTIMETHFFLQLNTTKLNEKLLYILLLTVDQFHQWFQIESYQHCPWELLRMGIPHLCNWSQFKYPILVIELSSFLSISLSLSFVALFLLYVFFLSPYKDPLWTELWETVKGGTAHWNGTSHLSSSEQYDQQQTEIKI